MTDHLDTARDLLRAWCHDRPDRDDPSTIYDAFGTISSIIATLEHIVDLASHDTTRATGSDDGRTVGAAACQVDAATRDAICAIQESYRGIGRAHEVVGHLIFAMDEDPDIEHRA